MVFSALCALCFCDSLGLSWTLLTAPAIISQLFGFFSLPPNCIENSKEVSPLQVAPLLGMISVITVVRQFSQDQERVAFLYSSDNTGLGLLVCEQSDGKDCLTAAISAGVRVCIVTLWLSQTELGSSVSQTALLHFRLDATGKG